MAIKRMNFKQFQASKQEYGNDIAANKNTILLIILIKLHILTSLINFHHSISVTIYHMSDVICDYYSYVMVDARFHVSG